MDSAEKFLADFREAYRSGKYDSQEFIARALNLCSTRKEAYMLIHDCLSQISSVHSGR